MITDFTTTQRINRAEAATVLLNQTLAMLPHVPTQDARKTLLRQMIARIAPMVSEAMDVATLFAVLDPTFIGTLIGVDVARLKAAATATDLLLGYAEAINSQTDDAVIEQMMAKLIAAIAPDRAHANAVAHSVVAVELGGPLAF